MSLEGDISLPPRGPVRWRWFTRILTALARASRTISPDGSLIISPVTGGITVQGNTVTTTAENVPADPWSLTRNAGGRYAISGGSVDILGYTVAVPSSSLLVPEGHILAMLFEYELTAPAFDQAPILNTLLASSDVVAEPTVEWVALTASALALKRVAVPRDTEFGAIAIPVAVMIGGVFERHLAQRDFSITVTHHDFTIFLS